MYDRLRDSYDRVADRYAEEIGDELAGKPVDRALLRCVAELARDAIATAVVSDLGCGPGHVAAHLTATTGVATVGIDISPAMIDIGRRRYPHVRFRLGSMLALPAADGEFAAAVALYSVIHLRPADRIPAYEQMARAIRPGGWLLLAFHVSDAGHDPGVVAHVDQWWGETVDLDFYYLDPASVIEDLTRAGLAVMARTDRAPWPGVEHPSQRCHLLCRRP